MKNKTRYEKWIEAVVILIIGLGALFAANILINVSNKLFHRTDTGIITTLQNESSKTTISPYEEIKTMTKENVITNFSNGSKEGKANDTFHNRIYVNGTIEKGYVYVKASIGGKALTPGNDVYLKLENNHLIKDIGGHLLSDKSIASETKSDEYTELLYPLNALIYKPNTQKDDYEIVTGDWLKMLNENQNDIKNILGFSSTLKTGVLIEVDIYYQCAKDTPNCSITVDKK